MVAHIVLHQLQLVQHLLASLLSKHRLRGDIWLVNVSECRRFYLILLVLHHISQVLLLASLLTLKFSALIH